MARLVMRSARGGNNISFTCREMNPYAARAEKGSKKRPASSRKREKDKRRREIWLERRNCPSSAGPSISSQQLQSQQQLQRTTAATTVSAAEVSSNSCQITLQQVQPRQQQHHHLQACHLESTKKQQQGQLSEQAMSISHSKKKVVHCRPVNCQWLHHQPAGWPVETPESLSISFPASCLVEDLTASLSMHFPLLTSSPATPLPENSALEPRPASAPSGSSAPATASATVPMTALMAAPPSAPALAPALVSALSYAEAVALCPTSHSPRAPPLFTAYVQIFSKRMVESFM
jgi:hypothetical protein